LILFSPIVVLFRYTAQLVSVLSGCSRTSGGKLIVEVIVFNFLTVTTDYRGGTAFLSFISFLRWPMPSKFLLFTGSTSSAALTTYHCRNQSLG